LEYRAVYRIERDSALIEVTQAPSCDEISASTVLHKGGSVIAVHLLQVREHVFQRGDYQRVRAYGTLGRCKLVIAGDQARAGRPSWQKT
jgi:hypothetical protein